MMACFWQVSWESDWCGCNSVSQSFLLVCAGSSMVEHDSAWAWNAFLTACVHSAVISVTCTWSTYDSAVWFRRLLKRGKITVTHLLWKHIIMPDSFDYMTHSPHKMKLRVWGRETHWQSISIHLVQTISIKSSQFAAYLGQNKLWIKLILVAYCLLDIFHMPLLVFVWQHLMFRKV